MMKQRQPTRFFLVPGRQRFLMRWIALLVCLSGFCWMPASPVRNLLAQEDPQEEPASDTSGGEAAEPADSSGAGETSAETEPPKTVLDTLYDGGYVGVLILLLSLASVGMMVEHSLTIRRDKIMPEFVMEELEQLIQQGQIDHAIEACADPGNESLAADVVLAGLETFQASEFGFAEYKKAVEEAGEDQTAKMYRKISVLATIGAIAPMLGLSARRCFSSCGITALRICIAV